MSGGDFYKGEKKKKKKGDNKPISVGGPAFITPTVAAKGKIKY